MRRLGVLAGLVTTMLVAGLVGCSSKNATAPPSQSSQASGVIVVFAAASLKPAFTKIITQFKAENSGTEVVLEPGGSSELATQLTLPTRWSS
jgi:molybdate transport system substrate-binding protein